MTPQAATVLAPPTLGDITREELLRRLHDPALTIVDALPRASYDADHIPGAISLPAAEVEERARAVLPNPAAEIVVYCAKPSCDAAEHAGHQLIDLGYTNVRHYHGGIEDWRESGAPFESVLTAINPVIVEPVAAPANEVRRESLRSLTARLHRFQLTDRLADFVDRQSTPRLFMAWIAMTLAFGVVYWLAGLFHHSGLLETGRWVDGSEHGLWSALYFSFVTVTSVGYGDVVPRGIARVAAVGEAVTGLLIFGAVVAKFVSRRQDEVVREIHRVTFDERIDRIQTNLHMLLSELQTIAMLYDDGTAQVERVNARMESATLVFAAELRTVHYLLYRPAEAPIEPVLAGILASLASALQALNDCLRIRPDGMVNSPLLNDALKTVSTLASEICGNCVPSVYAPALTLWMDRIQEIAIRLE